jgi:hypothetical protein
MFEVRAKKALAYRNVRYEEGEIFIFYENEEEMTPCMELVRKFVRTKKSKSKDEETENNVEKV